MCWSFFIVNSSTGRDVSSLWDITSWINSLYSLILLSICVILLLCRFITRSRLEQKIFIWSHFLNVCSAWIRYQIKLPKQYCLKIEMLYLSSLFPSKTAKNFQAVSHPKTILKLNRFTVWMITLPSVAVCSFKHNNPQNRSIDLLIYINFIT